jgi:hypothetical protein
VWYLVNFAELAGRGSALELRDLAAIDIVATTDVDNGNPTTPPPPPPGTVTFPDVVQPAVKCDQVTGILWTIIFYHALILDGVKRTYIIRAD